MSRTIHAIFEGGVFRPIQPIDLPERTAVALEIHDTDVRVQAPLDPGLAEIYAILGERYESGHRDTAERHDEHQP